MDTTIRGLIKLVRFTTGRRIFTLRQVREQAVAYNLPDVVGHIDMATAHDRSTLDMEVRWNMRGDFGRRHSPRALQVDNLVDQAVTGLRDTAQVYVRSAPVGDATRAAAERFLAQVFPAGVYPITSLPFIDQLAAVERILTLIATELSGEVAQMGLGPMIALLSARTDEYRAVLAEGPSSLEYSDVQAARDLGQDHLCVLVAMIISLYPRPEDENDERARADLLGPILAQQEAIRHYLNARKSVPDIDPDGEAPDEPGPEPAPDPGPLPELGNGPELATGEGDADMV